MPSLIVSSRNTVDSQILRKTAQDLGWITLRLDGSEIPEWFEAPDEQIALFVTPPLAFDLAQQVARVLLGCNADWTVELPARFLDSQLTQMTLAEALRRGGQAFVKHAISKAFPAGVYDAESLAEVTKSVPRSALVHVGEPVEWLCEYRCFVRDGVVTTISAYRRGKQNFADHSQPLESPAAEINAGRQFAERVLASKNVLRPAAFVLDIGFIADRGWAVVEFNECWASGIYGCDPKQVLATLLRACVPTASLKPEDQRWDFRPIYHQASGTDEP